MQANTATALSTIAQPSAIIPITSAKGKLLGHKMALSNTGQSFRDCRAAVRAADPTLKGDKLTAKVNEVFFGDTTVAVIAGRAAFEREIASGKVPNVYESRERSGKLTFVAPSQAMSRGQKVDKALKALAGVELTAAQKTALETLLKAEAQSATVEV